MLSILSSNADKPQPNFRSSTPRFPGQRGKFVSADPIHLEAGNATRARPQQASPPGAFQRGASCVMTTLGGRP